ncbi:MAG: glycosyltransferase family 25 protein, partial [Alphaproteobacteria bacterium]|nr:glycosyltransferase family 25 protein [Alphaproteobacteria bacterium]
MIPITVISLPHETQRRARIKNQLDRLGLSFSFFDAINGQDLPADMPLPYNEARRLRIFGRGLTQGEIGCLLSHKAVLEVIARSTTPCTLVLEDDVVIDAGLPGILQDIQTHANTFDLVRFLSGPKISRIKKRKILTLNTAGL